MLTLPENVMTYLPVRYDRNKTKSVWVGFKNKEEAETFASAFSDNNYGYGPTWKVNDSDKGWVVTIITYNSCD